MSVQQFLRIIRARLASILCIMISTIGAAILVTSLLPRQYMASARVLLDVPAFSGKNEDAISDYIDTQAFLLTEPIVTERVVRALGWTDSPDLQAAWLDATGGSGNITTWLAGRIAQSVHAGRVPGSTVLQIDYQATDREAARAVAGILRTAFLESESELRMGGLAKISEWNERQADVAYTALNSAIAQRTRFLVSNEITDDERDVTASLSQLNAMSERDRVAGLKPPASPRLDSLRQYLARIEQQLASQSQLGVESPQMRALIQQRAQTQQHIRDEQRQSDQDWQTRIASFVNLRTTVDAKYKATSETILSQGPIYDQLRLINDDIDLKSAIYLRLRQRASAFSAMSRDDTLHTILGDVVVADAPVYPVPGPIFIWAAIVGLSLALTWALTEELLSRRVRCPKDLEDATSSTVLVVIPA